MGLEARDRAPLSSHTKWRPAADRPDPVGLLEEQDATREPDLVPVRHGRMMVSPFTFYRGAAKIMAADLKDTPMAGLEVQLCGDAHLSNFGLFASPERILLFDLNDFDETLPGPFEYDVKRMAASFTIAARNNGFAKADTRAATLASVRAYREAMAAFAQMGTMDIWYAHLAEDELMASIRSAVAGTATQEKKARKEEKTDRRAKAPKKQEKRAANREKADRHEEKAEKRRRSGRRRLPRRRIPATACRRCRSWASWSTASTGSSASRRSSSRRATWPPPTACPPTRSSTAIHEQFRAYRATLQDDRRRPAGAVRDRGHGPQGRRRRQRRHPGVHRSAPGARRARPAVPAGQGGHSLGAGGPPAQEPVPAARRAGGAGAADDAGRQRHLPRLDEGRGARTATSTGASCAT